MDLISVIVPVYKVESYLDRCVASIVNQTYSNLEIILVDDGSPDNCGVMCDAWAAKDPRIKVIHKENGGLSDARNAGMAIATGKYIAFVDSDDYLAPEMSRQLFEHMVADKSDIATCGVEMVFEDGSPSRMLTKSGCCALNTAEAMASVIAEDWLKQPVWCKLYKTELIRDILFPVGKYHEDVFWTYRAVAVAQKVSILDTPCYFYTQRSGSIMGSGYSLKRLDAIEAKQHRLEFIKENFPVLKEKAQVDLLFSCLYQGQQALLHLEEPERRQVVEMLKDIAKELPPVTLGLPLTHKCWLMLAKCNFTLCCKIRNLLGIGQ